MRALMVQDDRVADDTVWRALVRHGYAVDRMADPDRAEVALRTEAFDLAIVAASLPREGGQHLVRELRRQGNRIPVMMIATRGDLADRIAALDLGADDYLTRPFQIEELLARCRALLRRAHGLTSLELSFGPLRLSLAHREASRAGAPLDLTRREWSILECLVLNAGRLVSKEKLANTLTSWGDDLTSSAIETHVSRLRGKLGDAAAIRAIRGLGYRIDQSPRAPPLTSTSHSNRRQWSP